jgi:hypothetical protein
VSWRDSSDEDVNMQALLEQEKANREDILTIRGRTFREALIFQERSQLEDYLNYRN